MYKRGGGPSGRRGGVTIPPAAGTLQHGPERRENRHTEGSGAARSFFAPGAVPLQRGDHGGPAIHPPSWTVCRTCRCLLQHRGQSGQGAAMRRPGDFARGPGILCASFILEAVRAARKGLDRSPWTRRRRERSTPTGGSYGAGDGSPPFSPLIKERKFPPIPPFKERKLTPRIPVTKHNRTVTVTVLRTVRRTVHRTDCGRGAGHKERAGERYPRPFALPILEIPCSAPRSTR